MTTGSRITEPLVCPIFLITAELLTPLRTLNNPRLQNEVARFHIWGTGFIADSQDLDKLLVEIPDLRRSCLVALRGIGYVLTGIYTRNPQIFVANQKLLQCLGAILRKTESEVVESPDYYYGQQKNDQEAVEQLNAYNNCLFDLVPALERIAAIFARPKDSPQMPSQSSTEGPPPDYRGRGILGYLGRYLADETTIDMAHCMVPAWGIEGALDSGHTPWSKDGVFPRSSRLHLHTLEPTAMLAPGGAQHAHQYLESNISKDSSCAGWRSHEIHRVEYISPSFPKIQVIF